MAEIRKFIVKAEVNGKQKQFRVGATDGKAAADHITAGGAKVLSVEIAPPDMAVTSNLADAKGLVEAQAKASKGLI